MELLWLRYERKEAFASNLPNKNNSIPSDQSSSSVFPGTKFKGVVTQHCLWQSTEVPGASVSHLSDEGLN